MYFRENTFQKKMITFKKIRYKNFLSTGNTPIKLKSQKSKTTLIVGTNGSGKSTLLMQYVLFFLTNHLDL